MNVSLLKSELVRNAGKLLSANVLAQVIGLAVYPILTRLYSSEDFGLLSLFVSIGSVLTLLGTAEYQYAIVLPKEDRHAVSVMQLSGITLLCVCGLAFFAVPFSNGIAGIFRSPALADWLWGIPLYVLMLGGWSLLNYWLTRQKSFGKIAGYQMVQSATGAGSKVGMGYVGWTGPGLIASTLLASFVGLLTTIAGSFRQLAPLLHFDRKQIKEIGYHYRNFPCFSLPRAIINNVSGNLGVWLLTPAFGLEAVGFLGLAITLAFRPLNVISNSIYQVLFQRTSEHVQNKESIAYLFRQLLSKVALVAGVGFLALYWVLPPLCGWLLSGDWEETGLLIQMMLPWLFFSILVAPICFLADVFSKQKTGLLFEILLVATRAAGLALGIWQNSFHLAVLAYSLGSAIVIACQLMWYIGLIRRYERTLS